jgi:hypothetical protein
MIKYIKKCLAEREQRSAAAKKASLTNTTGGVAGSGNSVSLNLSSGAGSILTGSGSGSRPPSSHGIIRRPSMMHHIGILSSIALAPPSLNWF